jgi:hypothetical protein
MSCLRRFNTIFEIQHEGDKPRLSERPSDHLFCPYPRGHSDWSEAQALLGHRTADAAYVQWRGEGGAADYPVISLVVTHWNVSLVFSGECSTPQASEVRAFALYLACLAQGVSFSEGDREVVAAAPQWMQDYIAENMPVVMKKLEAVTGPDPLRGGICQDLLKNTIAEMAAEDKAFRDTLTHIIERNK